MMVCPNCKTENDNGALSCASCNTSFPDYAETVMMPGGSSEAARPSVAAPKPAQAAGVLSPPPDSSETRTFASPQSYPQGFSIELELGTMFGPRYRIESVLGGGGMGKVYKAYDIELNRMLALKLVRPELAADPDCLKRFKQELLLASKISHKNILRIHDLGDVGGVKFISMAFVEGQDLDHVLRSCGRLPVERALHITRQLCAALEAAHTEGVVHRDFKPANILVDQADNVYVSDFGLAKSLEAAATMMTRTGQIMGTPRYMAPEQVEAKPADHRADLYALGLILYEMVTGEAPFRGETSFQLMFQRVHEKPIHPKSVNPDVPDYLVDIIMRCLEKDPERRYQHAQEILDDLEAACPATTRSLPAATRILPPPPRRSFPKWSIPAAAAVLVLGGGLLVRPVRQAVLHRIHFTSAKPREAARQYLAVLPFEAVGAEPALKDVAGGVVDAISAKLSQLKSVYVASPEATAAAGAQLAPDQIAHNLGVRLLVEGKIQGEGDKLSVLVSLYDSTRKQQLWNQEFTGSMQDLLTVEGQIYAKLLATLDLTPSNEEMARADTLLTNDTGAYQLYLQARSIMHGERNLENVTKALGLYNQAILKDPGFALAYTGLAEASQRLYTLENDPIWSERALHAAEHARDLNNKLPEAHFELGTIYSLSGKTAEAIAEIKTALELAPNSDEGNRRLGGAYDKAGKEQEALQAYLKAVEVNPYYWLNYNQLGIAYSEFGRNQEALQALQKATQLAPDSESAYSNLGGVYFQMGKFNEAVSAFQKSLNLRPSARAYSNLGTAYFYLNRYGDAAAMFEKAVAMSRAPSQVLLGNLADAYRWLGQRDKANVNYDKAIARALKDYQVNPRDSRTLELLGLSYAKKGDSTRGLDFIRRAREIDPHANELMYNEGVIRALAGQKAEALDGLRQAFQHGYPVEQAKNDPELRGLQADPQFDRLLKEFTGQSQAKAATKP
jgi:eukaryotic-like serine/threonine-protein kinase